MVKGKILSKSPCNSDLFEGQVHQKLAEKIADEIANDRDCTIIGIDGGWGSGKSNLVGMIEKTLTQGSDAIAHTDRRYSFFTYDAWGHQNDFPRRSILEELTSFLTSGEDAIFNEQDWKVRLENLLAKKKRTSTKTVPSLNFALATMALIAMLTPIVNSISDNIPTPEGKLIFLSLFYLVAIGFVVFKQIYNMKKYRQPINLENFCTELFLLYKDKIKEDEKFETVSEKEPSTKQFKDWMSDINTDLESKKMHLVIVIDNMDRLPKIKVQELWSALHSFFSEKKYSNIKVIVPFDRSHIRNAFQSEDIENDTKKAIYGDDFINKTFYIVYHVAQPILSGWKQYFELQWNTAFNHEYPVDNSVLQVYDLLTEEHSPRKIVAFINEFVTLKSVVDSKIPDKYIALYIFGRTKISETPMVEILTPSYLGALEFMYKEDKNMPGYVSAIHYQLPLEDAVDVVYTRQFTKELDDNSLSSILAMKESGVNKFNAILDRAIADVTNTNNATMALEKLFGIETSKEIKNCWECLYLKDRTTRGEIKKYLPYHSVLLSHIQNKSQLLKDLIRGYHNNFSDETNVKDYLLGIDELANVEGVNLFAILDRVKREIAPKQFIELVANKHFDYKKYGLTCSDKQLSDYLSEQDLAYIERLTILPFLDSKEYRLDSFKEKIKEDLSSSSLDSSKAEILFTLLKESRDGKTINYRDYFDSSKLENLYNNTSSAFKYDLISMKLSELGSYSSTRYLSSIMDSEDEDMVKELAKVSYYYVNFGDLLCSIDSSVHPLVNSLCKYIATDDNMQQTMDVSCVAKRFSIIIENSEIAPKDLVLKMNAPWNNKQNVTVEIIDSLPIELFQAAKSIDCELSSYLLEIASNYLQSLSQEEWTDSLLEDNSFNVQLLKLHHTNKVQPFFDALKDILKKYANGSSDSCFTKDKLAILVGIAEELQHEIKKLFLDIRDIFLSSSITTEKLILYGDWLFKYGNLSQKIGCLEKILPSEIIDDNMIIRMLYEHKEIVKGMVDHSQDPSEFLDKLKAMALGNRKDDESLADLCKYLCIFKESSRKDKK